MLKSGCVLFSLLFVAPFASAEIFKCVGKRGETLYQNFPCELESMSKMAEYAQTDQVPSPTGIPSPTGPLVAAKKAPAAPAEPTVGMTTDEVRAIWGEPTETVQEEPGNGPRFEVWSYGDSRSVRFDRKGRVSSVQQ